MSAPGLLSSLSSRLSAPLPARSRFLRELAFDVQELTTTLVQQGHAPDEALRRATEMLVPDPETVARLERIHRPGYRRWTEAFDARLVLRLERLTLFVVACLVVGASALALAGADLLADPSPFLWPVLGLGSLLVTAVAAKAFQLWIKGDHSHPRWGLGAIQWLSALTLLVAGGGTLVDALALAAVLERAPDLAGSLVWDWVVREASLLCVAIVFVLTAGLGWMAASGWIGAAEDDLARSLTLDQPNPKES